MPGCDPVERDNDMSNETDTYRDPQDSTVALFLMENDGDKLTDILVAALSEAFRILGDDIPAERLH
jgi:hypothetical protein